MFEKILIANRGEIACRIMRTAQRLGIGTVAVYSEADREALHVAMADEAVAIGPAPSAESYLVADRIVEACKTTGAQAVHPGYGFLSENASFAKALDAAGITFIGPNVEAIAAMGDKIESKKLADKAGVSTVPGHIGVIADADEAVKIARDIGYPVMIKASAGGGGKGMRVARSDDDVADGFRSATSEAKSSFGDERVFIEKFVEEPRHIEIQVLADARGGCIHLGERECSIQRRHQKIIEEAPSPFLDAETRAQMGAQAVALAKAVDYRSAGTVEFIVDRDRNFYFLEMNTRLQVEHPVTEYVTGIDLVEQMIRVAAGEPLSLTQEEVTLDGWAVEARVYAEDPYREFLPSIGRLTRYIPPEAEPDIRLDSGVGEGDEISMFYDPMIAKLIARGDTREEATDRIAQALDAYYIRGVEHNIGFLAAVVRHPRFAEGRLSTNFIPEEFPDGFAAAPREKEDLDVLIAAAASINLAVRERDARISGRIAETGPGEETKWTAVVDGDYVDLSVSGEASDCEVVIGGAEGEGRASAIPVLTGWGPGDPLFFGQVGGRQVCVQVDRRGVSWRLQFAGLRADIAMVSRRTGTLARRMPKKEPPDFSKFVLAPMPGLLVSVAVEVGQPVKAGEEVAVVEAMKMENILRAARDGTVKEIRAAAGDHLAVEQVIVEFE